LKCVSKIVDPAQYQYRSTALALPHAASEHAAPANRESADAKRRERMGHMGGSRMVAH